jgi:hypothetical protein
MGQTSVSVTFIEDMIDEWFKKAAEPGISDRDSSLFLGGVRFGRDLLYEAGVTLRYGQIASWKAEQEAELKVEAEKRAISGEVNYQKDRQRPQFETRQRSQFERTQ